MAVLANESGMSSEGEIKNKDSSHEFNVYVDRQLQNKLIQAAEVLDQEEYDTKLSKAGSNLKKSSKVDPRVEDITGWFTHAKFVARRNNDGAKSESKPQKDTFIHPWRDYRAKKEETYVFKHYNDTKKYIEQYRNDHSCQNVRYSSGGQSGEMRRLAFQNATAPPQQMQQGNTSANSSAPLQYTNRKDSIGTLITSNPNCSCARTSHISAVDANLAHRYKFAPAFMPGQMSRTNTEIRSHYGDSDNSSESSDFGMRTPTRRISSAASVRSKVGMSRTPTKITVPANPNTRPYPIQALTIQQQQQQQQQNGKPESGSSSKPLDNLNCVAPEKQMTFVGRKEVEPLGFTLNVHNISDLLTTNEAPLRGYALPKSSPPTPKRDNMGFLGSSSDSIADDDADVVSLDQLSTCPLGAEVHVKPRPSFDAQTSEILKMFLNDPVLNKLNKRPFVKDETTNGYSPYFQSSYFGSDHICMPQADPEGMSRVNMWNPIVSVSPNLRTDTLHPNYKNMMSQGPFRKVGSETRLPKTAHIDFQQTQTYSGSRRDFFNPTNNIKLSITKLDNGVSFCQTTLNSSQSAGKKFEKTLKSAIKLNDGSEQEHVPSEKSGGDNGVANSVSFFDPYTEGKGNPVKTDNKICLPLPKVKIFESIPVQHTHHSNIDSSETNVFPDIERLTSYGSEQVSEDKPRSANVLEQRKRDGSLPPPERLKSACVLPKPTVISNENNAARVKNGVDGNVTNSSMIKGMKMNVEQRNMVKQMTAIGREASRQSQRSRKPLRKPSVASGKFLKTQPELEGLTWSEKLEVLRSVNKPPEKPKRKKPKLRYVKDEPEGVWNTEQEQLYEQRRIKHLLEQARIKGGKQFDWVYEAQMRAKGDNWDSGAGKGKVDNSASSGETSESEEEGVENRGRLGKYGIYVPPKGSKHTLFNSQPVARSNTFVSH